MTKETKKRYVELIQAMRVQVKAEFVPLATTYEGAFHLRGWRRFATLLGWEQRQLEELLQLTARCMLMRLHASMNSQQSERSHWLAFRAERMLAQGIQEVQMVQEVQAVRVVREVQGV